MRSGRPRRSRWWPRTIGPERPPARSISQDARFFDNLEEMFTSVPMDAVVIAEIPGDHLVPTQLAAARGIHVFTEKPMANTLEDCDRMIEACARGKVRLMVGFKHRFAKAMAHVQRELPRLGRPLWGMYTYPLWKVPDSGWKFDERGTRESSSKTWSTPST